MHFVTGGLAHLRILRKEYFLKILGDYLATVPLLKQKILVKFQKLEIKSIRVPKQIIAISQKMNFGGRFIL